MQTTKTTHTPGPWWANEESGFITSESDGSVPIRTPFAEGAFTGKHGELVAPPAWTREEVLANARLIAAAPDMLEALRECVTEHGSAAWSKSNDAGYRRRLDEISKIARAAIAKATGGAA